jgi:hypothetical protein
MNDVARFRPQDPPELVRASFACPLCLHEASVVRLPQSDDEPAAQCACLPCHAGWEVALSATQMLRLALAPPPGLATPPMWGVGSL